MLIWSITCEWQEEDYKSKVIDILYGGLTSQKTHMLKIEIYTCCLACSLLKITDIVDARVLERKLNK